MTDIEPTRPHPPASDQSPKGLLDLVEWVGNKLPDPVMLFFGGAILVMVLSGIGKWAGWSVEKPVVMPVTQAVLDETGVPVQVYSFSNVGRVNKLDLVEVDEDGDGVAEAFEAKRAVVRTPLVERFTDGEGRESYKLKTEAGTEPVRVNSLFSREGARWAIDSMVTNFTSFHPLGVVLVAMLGIGVAEKTGCIAALLKALMLFTPMRLLTPATVFVGVMSSMAADAGYVVLPPLAAALYKSVGRSPLVGLAAVFCGVGGGFSANLLPTSIDPLLAGLTQEGAQILNPAYTVNPLCNYFFMIASTVMLTLVGWAVTSLVVERRYEKKRAEEGGPAPLTAEDEAARHISPGEVRGLVWAGIWLAIGTALSAALILVPGAPLYADPGEGARWPNAIVPLLFVLFLIPGVVYGIVTGRSRGRRARSGSTSGSRG